MKRNTTPRIVEHGAGWYITFDPVTKDYGAFINDAGCIGYRDTKIEAFDLVMDTYCDERSIAAAMAQEGVAA